jgi:hypothetical protein
MKGSGMTGGSRYARVLRHGASVGALLAVATAAAGYSACYSTGDGSPPPRDSFYFPVGLTVSAHGNVLYVANSDFDLQYNGGTVQSYDLTRIRFDALRVLTGIQPTDTGYQLPIPYADGIDANTPCDPSTPPPMDFPNGGKRLGWSCAPPTKNQFYWRYSVVTGAFATTMELANVTKNRLFLPVRGDASLTWINLTRDDADSTSDPNAPYDPYVLDCGAGAVAARCSGAHSAGNNPLEDGNTRGITMPGEPFGMAQTADGVAIAVTHQTDTKTSLLLTGLDGTKTSARGADFPAPSLQFVIDGLPSGGVGIAEVPHDPAAVPVTPYPAFLQTSRSAAEVDLLRFHPDLGVQYRDPEGGVVPDAGDYPDAEAVYSSNYRPYLIRERTYPITANSSGVDSRSIAIDPTPRLQCEDAAVKAGAKPTDATYVACAQLPARVFIANRAPSSLLVGQIGQSGAGGKYDPDGLTIFANVPLSNGPSSVFLAPIVDKTGHYALRVFIACYDAQLLYVYDPDAQRVENIIRVGTAPYAMAFDPFDWHDVATHASVPEDPRAIKAGLFTKDKKPDGILQAALKSYRFAYIANFTTSYVQIMDLDSSFVLEDSNGAPTGDSSFETVVFTLGRPTQPKGQ